MKRQIHLVPGASLGLRSLVKRGALVSSEEFEVHVPYSSTWFLMCEGEYNKLVRVDEILCKLALTKFGRMVLRALGVSTCAKEENGFAVRVLGYRKERSA